MEKCNCGSGLNFDECCDKYLSGRQIPETPEQLMRSRYTAFTKHDIDYIMNTHNPDNRDKISKAVMKDWAVNSKWISLEIISTEKGGKDDLEGIVEFKAKYETDKLVHTHHEKSLFIKKDNIWYYSDDMPLDKTIKNDKKIGRNDPCPCGSGKKYKKCCGK